ncbi:META domain-containing protein [Deinococcus psychrotolerans]|uniref:META domain-containing protein n=1 Tax=Deinococcus psychrotolerans TaxID=2489213 RepID=A0A3G8YFR2_9DEIO|nr:META domain-containing protein [Deinococcus psychrotolerans]AZI44132.1 META domain-containing protein [Deinococcus psychrotolerans]
MNRTILALCAALTLTNASAAQIADGTWTLIRLTDTLGTISTGGLDAPTLKLLGTSISTAEGTQVSGSTGCNVFSTSGLFGNNLQMGGTLKLGPIAATRKLCPETQMILEQRYLDVLAQARAFVRVGDTLILTSGTSKAVYQMGSVMESRLKATWRLVGGQSNEPLTVTFAEDGHVSGTTGCNSLMGTYNVMDGQLTFGPLATTRRACTDPALAEQEQTFLKDLSEVTGYQVAGSMLKLTTTSGKVLTLARPVN